jgi:hypothetical protein
MKPKPVLFVILLCVTTIIAAFAQPVNGKERTGPRISFSETEFDFGTVSAGEEAVHYFVFSNTGDAPLAIVNVRASCGCMASEWTKKPVNAGGRDSLRIEYNTRIKGSFNKTIAVQSNAENGNIELKIRGSIVKSK